MTTYVVTYTDSKNYGYYMTGHQDVRYWKVAVSAENEDAAVEMVRNGKEDFELLEVKTEKQLIEEKRAEEARIEESKAKEEKAKAKRLQNDERKAQEMGMTLAEYKTWKNRQATIRKYQKEIEELKAEIEKRESYIRKYSVEG